MFTGIVQGTAKVIKLEPKKGALTIELDLGDLAKDVQRGASISVGGVCLTVVHAHETHVRFDLMGETLVKTTLGSLKIGDRINIERSARAGDEIGGHLVSGHVTGMAAIRKIEIPANNWIGTFGCDASLMQYLLPKGFIALDGCSLTIVDVGPDWFTVHLIPETLKRTTFSSKVVGDRVQLEIDPMTRAIVDTVTRLIKPT